MKVIVATTYNEDTDMELLEQCIKSLKHADGFVIGVDRDPTYTDTLLRRRFSSWNNIEYVNVDTKKSRLGAVVAFCERYQSEEDVYCLVVDNRCTYPCHLVTEYRNQVDNLNKAINEKLPNTVGSAYGMSGVVMLPNKKKDWDAEFEKLINGDSGDDEETPQEKKTEFGYVRENATIDYLEISGSILIHRSQLFNDFISYINRVLTLEHSLNDDVLLCNFLASKKVMRTQICSIFINRFMMDRLECFKHCHIDEEQKKESFVNTAITLRKADMFRAYD